MSLETTYNIQRKKPINRKWEALNWISLFLFIASILLSGCAGSVLSLYWVVISLYSEEAVAVPFCGIGVKMGSLLSVLDRAILQCEGQATAPLCHHIPLFTLNVWLEKGLIIGSRRYENRKGVALHIASGDGSLGLNLNSGMPCLRICHHPSSPTPPATNFTHL